MQPLKTLTALIVLCGLVGTLPMPQSAAAQDRDHYYTDERLDIPPGHYPPPGECKLWFVDRPPGQQPPPTSCTSLRGRDIRGAVVLYHDGVYDPAYRYDDVGVVPRILRPILGLDEYEERRERDKERREEYEEYEEERHEEYEERREEERERYEEQREEYEERREEYEEERNEEYEERREAERERREEERERYEEERERYHEEREEYEEERYDDRRDDYRRERQLEIPPGHYPPPGECRLWYVGVPPGQQPPPGSCDDLRGERFDDAVVLYGDRAWDPYADYDWNVVPEAIRWLFQ